MGNVFLQKNWYGQRNKNGYLETSLCPKGYCCPNPIKINANSTDSTLLKGCSVQNGNKLCAEGRDHLQPFCGSCKPGLSETTSKNGICKYCNDSKGIWVIIIPNTFGF